jgi:hypothetical protein
VLAIHEVTENLAHCPPVPLDDVLQVAVTYRVKDPEGIFTLPLEGP